MNRAWKAMIGCGLAAGALASIGAAQRPGRTEPPAGVSSKVERGSYLVEHVARCGQCHTPRDESGNLLETRRLSGAPVPVASPYPSQPWAYRAPDIRGMNGYTDEEGVRLLMQGITRNGTAPQPPMQQFGMNREDAEAIVAYLKSLK